MQHKRMISRSLNDLVRMIGGGFRRRLANNPVQCLKNGRVKVFSTVKEAATKLGLDQVTINHAIKGSHGLVHHRYAGRIWAFCYPEEAGHKVGPFTGHKHTMETRLRQSLAKSAKKTAVEGISASGMVVRYESGAAASRAGFNRPGINQCLNGSRRSTGGFTWRKA